MRLRWMLSVVMTISLEGVSCSLQAEEYERLKATYLYQLSRFIQWPEFEPQQVFFSICLYNSEVLKPILEEAQGRKIEGRPFRVVAIDTLDNIENCQILFARNLDEKTYQVLLKAIDKYPVLFCSDVPGFSKLGGMLEFKHVDGTGTQIAINVDRVKQSGLFISANLMEMVEKVYLPPEKDHSKDSPFNEDPPLNGETL